jgi:hypothetical protein
MMAIDKSEAGAVSSKSVGAILSLLACGAKGACSSGSIHHVGIHCLCRSDFALKKSYNTRQLVRTLRGVI